MKAFLEVVEFEAKDIITTSAGKQCPTDICPTDCGEHFE